MRRATSLVRIAAVPALAVALLGLSGCGGGAAGGGGAGPAMPVGMAAPSDAGGATAAGQATVNAPRNATLTILCREFTGPDHAGVAERVRQQVQAVTGLRDFYLVRGEDRTVLYHGFYTTNDPAVDPKEGRRARSERDLIERLQDARKQQIFPQARFEPLQRPDPVAAPEWDLRNAKGFWSLLVCSYTDPARSKEAAVESVREMRKNGIEAYYFFKDTQAHVCIGMWPEAAVKRGTSLSRETNGRAAANPIAPDEMVVVSTIPLAEGWKQVYDENGRKLRLFEVRVELQDPTLKAAYGKYGYAVNGDYLANKYPLLLIVPEAIGTKPETDAAAGPARPTEPDQDLLLKRH